MPILLPESIRRELDEARACDDAAIEAEARVGKMLWEILS